MRIQLLGPVRAFTDLDEELPIGGPKQRAVLARLAMTPGRAVSVDQLTEAVWGQDAPERAHRSLATYMSNLRRDADMTIAGGNGSYTLEIDRSCVDLCSFEDELTLLSRSDRSEADGSETLRAALDRFVGMPFADVDLHGAFAIETTRLDELRLSALEKAVDLDVRRGRSDQAIPELEQLVTDHPDRERLRGLLMRALYVAGRQTEALKAYDTHRRQLQELGLDPSPELRDLELAILNHDDSLITPIPDGAVEPPQRRLPVRYSSFVGRIDEIERVRSSMADRRLITIVGPGGIGKSSLALEAVRGASLPDHCEVVQTAFETVEDGTVGLALAEAMGLQPAGGVDPVDVVTRYIGDRSYVLVLDGCEAHPGEIGDLINRVLPVAPNCSVVATSRVPLMLPGERVIRVEGLPIEDAVDLFADRADLDTPLDAPVASTVASVCEALDGMALAIELAAARARSIPLEDLEQRMARQMPLLRRPAGADGRHDSMARAIQWSTDLLTDSEQRAYRWLSVFWTGFRIRDALGVLATDETDDLVARLVEVSLLQPADEDGEYHYLEPIRQHAVHALEEAGESEAAHEAHARWMVDAARSAFRDEWSPRRRAMRTWLFRRRSEFLDAVRWSSENGHPDLAIGIFAAIGKIIWSFEDIGHVLQPMVRAFDDPRATQSPDLAIALADAAYALKAYDRPDDARRFVERAEAIVTSLDEESPESLAARGTVLARRSIMDCPDIVRHSDVESTATAIELLERAGSPNAGSFNVNRGQLLFRLGRLGEATATHEAANAWYLATTGQASPLSLNHLALVAAERDSDWDRADRLLDEAAEIQLADYDNIGAIGSYYLRGYISMILGQPTADAFERMMRTIRTSGGTYPFLVEMWSSSEAGDSDGVMRVAKQWLTIRTWHRVDNEEYLNHDRELTIYGDEKTYPRFIPVLLPIIRALAAAGQTDDARYFAREIPTIVRDARIAEWRFDLLGLWDDVRRELGVGEPEGATLEEIFDRLVDVIISYRLRPSETGPSTREPGMIDGHGAPATFTRIRHL